MTKVEKSNQLVVSLQVKERRDSPVHVARRLPQRHHFQAHLLQVLAQKALLVSIVRKDTHQVAQAQVVPHRPSQRHPVVQAPRILVAAAVVVIAVVVVAENTSTNLDGVHQKNGRAIDDTQLTEIVIIVIEQDVMIMIIMKAIVLL